MNFRLLLDTVLLGSAWRRGTVLTARGAGIEIAVQLVADGVAEFVGPAET